jgi:four helix bundle protein
MQDFRNLKVWQKAHDLTLLIYKATIDFPRDELFGLRNSLRKTSVEIPAYISEGCGKSSDVEFGRSLYTALAFANRLEYYAFLAFDLKMLNETDFGQIDSELTEVKKMLSVLNQRLR